MDRMLQRWLHRDPDERTRQELLTLIEANEAEEIAQRFRGRLEFGTAGLRGIVGAGPNRMNRLVVRETTAGLGNYLLKSQERTAHRGVVIGYDGRTDSRQFAQDAGCVLAAMGIRVHLTAKVAPTPVAAFGVRHLGCAAGVVITASHNPPEYNGYKVYWQNGAQIISPHDEGIASEIRKAADAEIPWIEFAQARSSGRINLLGEDFYQAYRDAIVHSPLFRRPDGQAAISIAYTAMHGVGADMAETLLRGAGFDRFHSVVSQREPDGTFPTVAFPNPEEPGAMDAVLALAKEKRTTLACANDPDADRLAVAVRTEAGAYRMLTGDQVGVLLGHYALSRPCDYVPVLCSSIVSSSLLRKVAEAAGAEFHETLTGFKWLINVALSRENNARRFLFAYEEALGYAFGRAAMDKDGLSALLAFAQMTAELAARNKSVLDELERLYRQHGLHLTRQVSIALSSGDAPVAERLRNSPPSAIAGHGVKAVDDLKVGERRFADGRTEKIDLPANDVLIYRLDDGTRVILRPSGTEPKLKCYYEMVRTVADAEAFSTAEAQAQTALRVLVDRHQAELALIVDAPR